MNKINNKKLYYSHFIRYKNPDKRCHYPFEPNVFGYCWMYSSYIDNGAKFLIPRELNSMEEICHSCEFWKK